MNGKTLKPRLKASGIHLSLSALAFFIVLYFIVFLWFPNPHFSTNGGWQGVRIMLFVDIVLGPLLTLIIFNSGKSIKAILFDLTVIGIIQISAFIWGLSAVYSQRPLAISFWEGRFYPILMEDLEAADVKPEQLKKLSHQSPAILHSRKPETGGENTGVVIFGKLYTPLEEHIDELFDVSVSNSLTTDDKFQIDKTRWLEKAGINEEELAFVPFRGRYGKSILIFNRKGELLDSITVK